MSEIRIRQLHYQKLPPQTTVPTTRSVNKIQAIDHKLGRTAKVCNSQPDARPFFENFMSRSDRGISISNGFRYTFQPHENNQSQIHFFEIFTHSQVLISTYITECKKLTTQIIQEKNQIKQEMDQIKLKHEQEIDVIQEQFKVKAQQKYKLLKENYVTYSTESYRLNKEVCKLTKDKLHLEDEAVKLLQRIIRLEKTLQGVEMNLICENDDALQIQLRGTFQHTKTITQ